MFIVQHKIEEYNHSLLEEHLRKLSFVSKGIKDMDGLMQKLIDFQVTIPSWALGAGGTRFGRFSGGGEPRNLEEKIKDIGMLHSLNRSSGAVSLHIPWDTPDNVKTIKQLAIENDLRFDAINSNTFQDQPGQKYSYKFGSLQHVNKSVRKQAIEHNIDVIRIGKELGSTALTVWLADGSCFPGQLNFRTAFQNTLESLKEIYSSLPSEWKLLLEYKPFEPNFYSTTVADWGQALLYVTQLGPKAFTLIDLGHHLPNTNIEQIVSLLLMEGRLGGFHFNDSKFGDDDLTVGSMKPYQLFLIFNELVEGMDNRKMNHAMDISWMIDASHNVKDPLEDILQSVEAIMLSYAQALLVDHKKLAAAQQTNDVVMCQEIVQQAFRTDVRPLVAEARRRAGGALEPISVFREEKIRAGLIRERGSKTISTGL